MCEAGGVALGQALLGSGDGSPGEVLCKPELASLGSKVPPLSRIKAKRQVEGSWGQALVTGACNVVAKACEEVESGG